MARHRPSALLVVAVVLGFGCVSALASTASEERQGAALAQALNSGRRTCSSLSSNEFDRVGEYAMGLNFATAALHDAMNTHMRAMMGARGEELAHQAMGRAYTGCGTASGTSGSWGGMMTGTPYGPAMMRTGTGHHDWSAAAVIGAAALAAALAGGIVALAFTRSGRHRHQARPG